MNYVRVGFFLELEDMKSNCVQLVVATALFRMNLQSMGFEIETFTDVELVSSTKPTPLLGQADVVDKVGVDVLRYHM